MKTVIAKGLKILLILEIVLLAALFTIVYENAPDYIYNPIRLIWIINGAVLLLLSTSYVIYEIITT